MRAFSAVATKRIPSFVSDDYPEFAAFIKAYYDWAEQTDSNQIDFINVRDIDETPEKYITFFRKMLAKGIPEKTELDQRILLKYIRELFKAKGTEKAIKFLFKVIFDDSVEVSYPRDQMIHSSDAKWKRIRSVLVQSNFKTPLTVAATEAYFDGTTGGGSLFIESAFYDSTGTNLKLIVSNVLGNIENATTLTIGDTNHRILPQVVGCKIVDSDPSFKIDRKFKLSEGVVAVVKELVRRPIEGLQIVNGGTGYSVGDTLQFHPLGPIGRSNGNGASAIITSIDGGAITGVSLTNRGLLYDLPPAIIVNSNGGEGAEIVVTGEYGNVKSVDIIDGGTPTVSRTETVDGVTFTTILGNIVEHRGQYLDNTGFISSNTAYLQDEHFYQYFSYVIKSSTAIDQYRNILKDIAHPAGMRAFGNMLLYAKVKEEYEIVVHDIILNLFSHVTNGRLDLVQSVIRLVIENFPYDHGVARHRIDESYKFTFNSRIISHFGSEQIINWMADEAINPYYWKQTNIRHDAVLRKIRLPIPLGDGGIGNDPLGDMNIG